MREIKFRYKIKNKEELFYDTDEEFGYLQKKRKLIAGSSGQIWLVEDETQFTGLKDKNGKEIYEGDIVEAIKYDNQMNKVKWYAKIKWGAFCYCLFSKDNVYHRALDTPVAHCIQVIGNIYENPELLEY